VSVAPAIVLRNAQRKVRVDVRELGQFAQRALHLCLAVAPASGESGLALLEEVSIALISDERIAALHKQFMNIDGPTDVLTCQHGEIFVSVETAEHNAGQFRTTAEQEIRLYIVHGLLHLHGFDDTAPDKARRMESMQERILAAASAA
jgi:probable rRNA maturation factor